MRQGRNKGGRWVCVGECRHVVFGDCQKRRDLSKYHDMKAVSLMRKGHTKAKASLCRYHAERDSSAASLDDWLLTQRVIIVVLDLGFLSVYPSLWTCDSSAMSHSVLGLRYEPTSQVEPFPSSAVLTCRNGTVHNVTNNDY